VLLQHGAEDSRRVLQQFLVGTSTTSFFADSVIICMAAFCEVAVLPSPVGRPLSVATPAVRSVVLKRGNEMLPVDIGTMRALGRTTSASRLAAIRSARNAVGTAKPPSAPTWVCMPAAAFWKRRGSRRMTQAAKSPKSANPLRSPPAKGALAAMRPIPPPAPAGALREPVTT
jgi:hypothetical protein